MILYDPSFTAVFRDYGIMLPISPSRAEKIAGFLDLPAGLVLDAASALRLLGGAVSGDALVGREDIERVHSKEYTAALYGESGVSGKISLEKTLLDAYELIDGEGKANRYEPERAVKPLGNLFDSILAQVGGTCLACRLALHSAAEPPSGGRPPGFCYYLGGGMHHARHDTGAGFCLVNDIMIAARKIQAEKKAACIWIVDVDAHKGCGTAELVRFARQKGDLSGGPSARPRGGPEILNLSIHMAAGWPLDADTLKNAVPGRAPLVPADVEIPIEEGGEGDYLDKLKQGLHRLEALSAGETPDLAIVVDGADPYEYDGLPSSSLLKLSLAQCVERDRLIFGYFAERGTAQAWIMAGGYGDRAWEPPAYFLHTIFPGP